MKLAISNIAWRRHEEPAVAELLRERGVGAVEIAPTTVWPHPADVTPGEARAYRDWWHQRGIQIVALQALLFGRDELVIFAGAEQREETREYLKRIIALGASLGASALVFGSPRNRRVGALDRGAAQAIARELFRDLGDYAAARGTCLCIEPNPVDYGCDFVVDAGEGMRLVEAVGSPGFQLHLDAAAMHLAGDPVEPTLEAAIGRLRHFHISAPRLTPVADETRIDYRAIVETLARLEFAGHVSIEMRAADEGTNLDPVGRALERLKTLATLSR